MKKLILLISILLWLSAGIANSAGIGITSPPPSDEAYNATTWDGVTGIAPSKNAVRDKIESMGTGNVATDTLWDAAGDILQGTGANAGERLAIGTAGQVPTVNAGATKLEYTLPIPFVIATDATADVIAGAFSPAITLTNGRIVAFEAKAANATTTPTFNANGLGAKVIVKQNNTALVAGDIPGEHAVCLLEYNLSHTVWVLLNPAFPQTTITGNAGTASNLSGTPALPNGTSATTQSQADASTKLATTAYVDTGLGGKAPSSGIALTALANQAAQTVNANATDGAAAPTAVAIGASQVVARLATGNIKGASAAEMKTSLGYYTSGDAIYASPQISKGPAIITSFAGTVGTGGISDATVVFSSAADAILAGYSATNPVLGTTLITADPFTRYIVSWNSSTSCEVDSVVTLANGTAITSVQLPIATFVNSAGVIQGWMNAAGNVYFVGNVGVGGKANPEAKLQVYGDDVAGTKMQITTPSNGGILFRINTGADGLSYGAALRHAFYVGGSESLAFITNGSATPALGISVTQNILTGGLASAGTSAAKVLAMGSGTAPTTSPADAAQFWVADRSGAGTASLFLKNEDGTDGFVLTSTGGNAVSSTYASALTVAASTTNASFYIPFFSATTGNLAAYVATGLYFNPSTGAATFPGAVTATSFSANKVSGTAGALGLYEADSTGVHTAGFIGPTSITGDLAYAGQFPVAGASSANMVLAWAASSSGAGTAASPYIHAMSFVDLDNYAPLVSPSFTTPAIGAATGASLIATGIVDGLTNVKIWTTGAYTANATGKMSEIIVNKHATPATAFPVTMSVPIAGMQLIVKNGQGSGGANTGVITLTAGTNVIIRNPTTKLDCTATQNLVSGGASSDYVALVAMDTTHWESFGSQGAWTCTTP